MKIQNLRNGLIAAILGLLALSAASGLANAQDNSREYRDWQRAQTQAEQRYNDYLRTRRSNDYRRWQQAQAEAQRRQSMYQQRAYNNRSYYPNNNVYVTPGVRYRVYRNGQTFYVDSRGASMLRAAINTGYQQGYQQGILDRRYGRDSTTMVTRSIAKVRLVISLTWLETNISIISNRASSVDMRTGLTIRFDTELGTEIRSASLAALSDRYLIWRLTANR